MTGIAPKRVAVVFNRPMDSVYTYSIPPELADAMQVGALVEVPLASRSEIACVVELDPEVEISPRFELRAVIRRVSGDFLIDAECLALCRWMADYYFCSWGEALATASFIGFADVEPRMKSVYTPAAQWDGLKLTAKQRAAMDQLPVRDYDSLKEIADAAACSPAIARKLVDLGALTERIEADEPTTPLPSADVVPELSDEQDGAFREVLGQMTARRFGVTLLHGVTGSGKTEVYLRLIGEALQSGRTALCLVPEIALTPQTVDRFARRFQEEIGVFHSQMSRAEKRVLWEKIRRGAIRVVIGARSAAFAPLPNLGIVIVDEEHESTYKQGEVPRYHARDLLIYRASRLSIPVVLGSATPSLESYANAQGGKYHLRRLTRRPAGLNMPEVRIVPLGAEAVKNPAEGFSMFSQELRDAISKRLARNEQTILFLNRRGFSNFLMCPSCRWVARCADDDIVLTVHRTGPKGAKGADEPLELDLFPGPLQRNEATLKCHFCGTRHSYPEKCGQCGEEGLVAFGSGTQRVEEGLRRLYPDARILRLDQDSVGGRQAFLKAWEQMVSGEAQIILGTQMIAKGLHLERVTLVGVILADVGLFLPDFRAEERVFSLLMQVSGRAGRQNMGEVLLQTYMGEHAGIKLAAAHDYEGFYRSEMERRRRLRFPPVEKLTAITISDPDRTKVIAAARGLAAILRRRQHQLVGQRPFILGPQAAPIERLANRFRQRILLRCPSQRPIADLLSRALADEEWRPSSTTRTSIDVDPQDLL